MTHNHIDEAGAEQFWEARYRERERIWSGNPNAVLVRVVTGLPPGTALDLGCGEGADAVWLAQQGWRVTAVDVSRTALQRAEEHADAVGVGDRIEWQQHDLALSFPDGSFDLVSAQFLHSPVDFPRERVLRTAAAAVASGGLLLIVGHAGFPPWSSHHDHDALPTPHDVLESLQLAPEQWKVELLDSPTRDAIGPDGQTGQLTDSVLAMTRLST